MKTITVPQKVYEEMKEIRDKQGFISDAFDLVSTMYASNLHSWLYHSVQMSKETSRQHEEQFVKYFYGELNVEPEPEKLYNVYYKIGKSMHGDWNIYVGAVWFQGRVGIDTADNEERFYEEKFTMSDIKLFESSAEMKFPKSALHEVDED